MKLYQDETKKAIQTGRLRCILYCLNICIAAFSAFLLTIVAFYTGILLACSLPEHPEYLSGSLANYVALVVLGLICPIALLVVISFADYSSPHCTADSVLVLYHKQHHSLSIFSTKYRLYLPNSSYDWRLLSTHYSDNHDILYTHKRRAYHAWVNISFNIDPSKLTDLGRDVLRQSIDDGIDATIRQRIIHEWLNDSDVAVINDNDSIVISRSDLLQNPYGFQNLDISAHVICRETKKELTIKE